MDGNWISYLAKQIGTLETAGSGLLFVWVFLGLILYSLVQTWLKPAVRRFTQPILLLVTLLLLFGEGLLGEQGGEVLFSGMLVLDFSGQWSKVLMLASLLVVLVMLPHEKPEGEFFPLMLGGVLGGIVATISQNLLLMILSLELLSLVSYIMVAMENQDKESAHSALQYLLFGLFSSAISLYGLSWLYGLTGTFDLTSPAFLKGIDEAGLPLFLPVFLLLMGTFMFKLSAFPFHFWTPEVYKKASYPLIAYLSTIPKIAGAFVFLRIFHVLGRSSHAEEVQLLLLVLAGLSMTWGNLSALAQEHFKAMAAFSGVAHAGYILMGMAWMSPFGEAAVMFYVGAYVLMNLGGILAASRMGDSDAYLAWAGKSTTRLFPAINLMVHLVALTGLPPSVGFIGKLYLFSSGVGMMTETNQVVVTGILTLAIINTLISLFYYLKPAIWLFLRKGNENEANVPINQGTGLLLGLLSLLVVLLGIFGFGAVMDHLQSGLWN